MTTGKTIALTSQTFVSKVMSLPFKMLSKMEKEMATHSSTLAWEIPCTEEPGRLQSMGSQRVRHDWETTHSSWSQLFFQGVSIYIHPVSIANWLAFKLPTVSNITIMLQWLSTIYIFKSKILLWWVIKNENDISKFNWGFKLSSKISLPIYSFH